MTLLEVAPNADTAPAWSNIFFGVAVVVAGVYFGWELFKVGRNYRERAKQAQEAVAASESDENEGTPEK